MGSRLAAFLLLVFVYLVNGNDDILEQKGRFMEAGMDPTVDPCEDFWSFANANLSSDVYDQLISNNVLKAIAGRPGKRRGMVVEALRKEWDACLYKTPEQYQRELALQLESDSLQRQEIEDHIKRLSNKSYTTDNRIYITHLINIHRLLFKYGSDEFDENFVHLALFDEIAVGSGNPLFEFYKMGIIFGEEVDMRQVSAAALNGYVKPEDRISSMDLYIHRLNQTLRSPEPDCFSLVLRNYPMVLKKMLHDYYGQDYVDQASSQFRDDLDTISKTAETFIANSNVLSDETKEKMLENLRNNTFYLIDHPIFEDGTFERFFGNVTFHKPAQNRNINNILPLIRAAAGKSPTFYFTADWVADNAYHAWHTHRSFFDWPVFVFPVYHPSYPTALRFSGAGFIGAHELGHDFTKIEANGEFSELADCLSEYYAHKCNPERPEICTDPKTSIGENFADYFGIRMAYYAYKRAAAGHGVGRRPRGTILDRLSDDQLFFVNFAQTTANFNEWNQESAEKVHSPAPVRLLGALSGFRAFSNAFNCPAGSKFHRKEHCKLYDTDVKPNHNLTYN
ncbi:unnamed protein product [Bursaphelenchus xylophilus]|uniref:(pine wood nematode) hypothetical protein n=1 Tax=Bursaphelenchus xylophilus TaxID=6326 RepID=A0A1I7RU89_BURXY|nr:unnamed protein product [Bursaphelenchus xylophilus]CAG9113933.1 unnamed protein product [Bursaphelenchus xylophilus]